MVVGSSLTLNYHFGRNGLAYPHNKFNKQSKKDTRTDVLFTCERMTKSSVRVLVGKLELWGRRKRLFVVLPAFEGGGTIACDGGWFSTRTASFCRKAKTLSKSCQRRDLVKRLHLRCNFNKGFTFGEIVASQQRTFRHEKSKIFRATFLRRKVEKYSSFLFYKFLFIKQIIA